MRPTRMAGLLAAGALLVAGCGSEASKGGYAKGPNTQQSRSPAPAGGSGGPAQVTMSNIAFKPETLTVRVGQTISWKNEDGVPHDYRLISAGRAPRTLRTKEVGIELLPGDCLEVRSSGGGGWGPPARRLPHARQRDREQGLLQESVQGS